MKNGTKVIIILLIIIVLIFLVWLIVKNSHEVGENKTIEENIVNNETNEIETDQTENETSNEVVNETENNLNQTVATNNNNASNQEQQPEGKEEVESNEENQGVNEDQQAIEMAKAAWGINTDAYTFTIDSKQGDVYRVSVISNAMVIAYYDVNVKTGEVTEIS